MARQTAPQRPAMPQALNIPKTPINAKIFSDLGDDLIKASNQNFELYANLSWETGADDAYKKFGNDPIALSNALSKLTGIVSDLPQGIQDQMMPKMYKDSISLVNKARENQRRLLDKQNKAAGAAVALRRQNDIALNFFNVLAYDVTPEEERRGVDLEIYQASRAELAAMAGLTDSQGNYIFSEKERENFLNPKNAMLKGFNDFINRMELDTLKEWDKELFQNKDAFMERTGMDDATYQSAEKAVKSRMKALADTKTREIHGQAWYDAASLISNPIQTNIDKAKSYDFVDKSLIDKIAENSKKTTLDTWYDPTKKTSPGAFLDAYVAFAEATNNSDFSYEGRIDAGQKAAEALIYLDRLAKDTNMPPKMVEQVKLSIQKGLTDPMAARALQNINKTAPIQKSDPRNLTIAGTGLDMLRGNAIGRSAATAAKVAKENFAFNFAAASDSLLKGDYETFNASMAQANNQYWKDIYGFMGITPTEWQRLENDYQSGKPAIIRWMGGDYTFNGFTNNGPVFKVTM